ncbi:hypothetical protein PSAC2689_100190 [Paraburkholderia sacchari]
MMVVPRSLLKVEFRFPQRLGSTRSRRVGANRWRKLVDRPDGVVNILDDYPTPSLTRVFRVVIKWPILRIVRAHEGPCHRTPHKFFGALQPIRVRWRDYMASRQD